MNKFGFLEGLPLRAANRVCGRSGVFSGKPTKGGCTMSNQSDRDDVTDQSNECQRKGADISGQPSGDSGQRQGTGALFPDSNKEPVKQNSTDILQQALNLPPEERATIAKSLFNSVNPSRIDRLTKLLRRRKPLLESLAFIFIILATVVGGLAVLEYKKANKATARAQLYTAENDIRQKEMQPPGTAQDVVKLYCKFDTKVMPEAYVKRVLEFCIGGQIDPNSPLANVKNSEELCNFIWDEKFYGLPENKSLRPLYLHVEAYIYHLHNAWDYKKGGFISEQEWKSWKGVLLDVGAQHPIVLSVIYSGIKNKVLFKTICGRNSRNNKSI